MIRDAISNKTGKIKRNRIRKQNKTFIINIRNNKKGRYIV